MPAKATDIRPGQAIIYDGQLHVVLGTEHVKPGKGPAYVQAKMKNINTGSINTHRLNSSDKFETANIDRREMQYLYDSSGMGEGPYVFMDLETYDQIEVDSDLLPKSDSQWLKPEVHVTIEFYQANPLTVVLPGTVELEVVDTAPQPKGATVTNQLKEATLETGAIIRVPPFIENGQMVKVKPETGEYLGKV